MNTEQRPPLVKVWDPLVRIGHWVLVVAFFTAWFTGEEDGLVHVYAGYTVAAVVVIRVVWGFIGSRHARFTDFVRGPGAVFDYIRSLFTRTPQHFLGHNPAGGLMVLLLLASLGATTWTGLKLYAVEENAGPLASLGAGPALSVAPVVRNAVTEEEAEDDEHSASAAGAEADGEEYWEELHELFATITLWLVGLHVAGVLIGCWRHRENLIRAMVSGLKRQA